MRAYYLLVTVNPQGGEYFNIGGQFTVEVGEVLDHLIGLSDLKDEFKVQVDPDRLRPIDADLQVPNTEKFKQHTGWQPEIPFEQTMLDLLNYWRHRVRSEGNRFLMR